MDKFKVELSLVTDGQLLDICQLSSNLLQRQIWRERYEACLVECSQRGLQPVTVKFWQLRFHELSVKENLTEVEDAEFVRLSVYMEVLSDRSYPLPSQILERYRWYSQVSMRQLDQLIASTHALLKQSSGYF